jgi:6-phosphogluconate dehydrogenase
MVGLGRMGANMARRLLEGGHEVLVYDLDPATVDELVAKGATGAGSLDELTSELPPPRAVWIMLPAGDVTGATIARLGELLDPGDVVVDGGNSRHVDTVARAAELGRSGIDLVDSGTSGGVWGLAEGYCLMIGASEPAFARLEPVFETLAPPDGYARVGPPGSAGFATSAASRSITSYKLPVEISKSSYPSRSTSRNIGVQDQSEAASPLKKPISA